MNVDQFKTLSKNSTYSSFNIVHDSVVFQNHNELSQDNEVIRRLEFQTENKGSQFLKCDNVMINRDSFKTGRRSVQSSDGSDVKKHSSGKSYGKLNSHYINKSTVTITGFTDLEEADCFSDDEAPRINVTATPQNYNKREVFVKMNALHAPAKENLSAKSDRSSARYLNVPNNTQKPLSTSGRSLPRSNAAYNNFFLESDKKNKSFEREFLSLSDRKSEGNEKDQT
jgi:hypothetical protein